MRISEAEERREENMRRSSTIIGIWYKWTK